MIAARINLRSAQSAWATDAQSIIEFLDFTAHGSKTRHSRCDAIGFFHAQFFRIAYFDAALDLRTDDRQQRKLIDQLRNDGAIDPEWRFDVRTRSANRNVTARFVTLFAFVGDHDVESH